MRQTRDDDVVRGAVPTVSPPGPDRTESRAPAAGLQALGLAAGAVLAVAATLAVFLTDDARFLRVAVVAVAWAFVGAALLAGRRTTDQVAAAREDQPRPRQEPEAERGSELAARYDLQLELERRQRRESEDAVRAELTRLRGELAALTEIRTELAGLGELRTELGRLRTELGEQLAGQLTFERMVMRAPSVRGAVAPADDRTVESTPARVPAVDPGWDVGRRGDTTVVPSRPVPRPVPAPPPVPPSAPPPVPPPVRVDRVAAPTPSVAVPAVGEPLGHRHRRAAERDDAEVPAPATVSTPVVDAAASSTGGSYDGARYDELLFGSTVPAGTGPVEEEPAERPRPEPQGHARLTQILADSGVEVPTGGRSRRRRYRDEDGGTAGDDVLARVLGRT